MTAALFRWVVPAGAEAAAAWLRLRAELGAVRWVACAGDDAEAWWSTSPLLVAEAVEACGHCPVRDACREYAFAAGERAGVWGGLTPAERIELARGSR
ncbi:MAG: WhiB family transcriptional regulator [Micromonosporaceae bacterium]